MKIFKTILFSIIVYLLFTFCSNKKSEKSSERIFTNVELIGKWNQLNLDDSLKDKDSIIKSVHLVNDSVAEIQLMSAKVIMGKWKNGFEKKSEKFGIAIESGIAIVYNTDKQNTKMLLLEVSEKNKKFIMSTNKLQFEKE